MSKKKYTKLKCAECGQKASKSDRVHWIYLGSMALVMSVSKSNNIFVKPIENMWVCSVDCLEEYLDFMMTYAEERDKFGAK